MVYHLFCLTELTSSVEIRMILIGNSVLINMTLSVLVFVGFYVGPALLEICFKLKIKRLKAAMQLEESMKKPEPKKRNKRR